MSVVALIPAAGVGSRMQADRPKQYLEIAGRPVLWHVLRTFCQHTLVDRVVVVLSPEDDWFGHYDWQDCAGLEVLRVGGASRGESVVNGLRALDLPDHAWVLVHDAARPGLTAGLIDRLWHELSDDEVGGLLALPVADTVKRQDGHGRVAATVSREGLWQAQTPQMFRYGLLLNALDTANPATVTDEASAIEQAGFSPRLVPGHVCNAKLTYPDDLEWVGYFLEHNGCFV